MKNLQKITVRGEPILEQLVSLAVQFEPKPKKQANKKPEPLYPRVEKNMVKELAEGKEEHLEKKSSEENWVA